MKIQHHIRLSIAMQILALIALFASHLALTDIYHGERDTVVEWRILQASALILVIALGESIYTHWKVAAKLRDL